jgi:DNA repair protein RadD
MNLRDYQITAIEKIDTANSAIYVLPTGGGKTVIFAASIKRLVERGERVLIVCHRNEILNQTSRKLSDLGIEHGIIRAGLVVDLSYAIQLASIQTLSRRTATAKLEWPRADVVIMDECHHARARTWQAVLNAYQHARRYGLTATPCRGDGKGLGDLFDELIVGPQVSELQKSEHLVPVKYFAPAKPDLKGVRTRQGDYAVGELAERMNRAHLIGDIVTQWHRLAERRRTIVFAVDIGHSEHIRREFVAAGVRCEHLDGSTPREERDAILGRLASGETEVVTNCMVLTEGFDCPPVGCIVLARPTKQMGLYRQMAGRGLRPSDGKSNLILIDHSGAVHRHGLLEDEISWTLDVDGKAKNAEHDQRTEKDFEAFVDCSQCGAVRERGEACSSCGFKPGPRPDLIITTDEDLIELGQRAPAHDRQQWHAMLAHIAQAKGYKPGWVYHKFKEKFGSPPYGYAAPVEPTPEVLSWVRSRQIAYANAMQKAARA